MARTKAAALKYQAANRPFLKGNNKYVSRVAYDFLVEATSMCSAKQAVDWAGEQVPAAPVVLPDEVLSILLKALQYDYIVGRERKNYQPTVVSVMKSIGRHPEITGEVLPSRYALLWSRVSCAISAIVLRWHHIMT